MITLCTVLLASALAVSPGVTPAKASKPCKDRVVAWIDKAGFTGIERRVAWSIAQRESNGNPNESSYPDLGIVQLNAPSWQHTKYWPANVYDPVQSFTAMRRMVRDMNWQFATFASRHPEPVVSDELWTFVNWIEREPLS